MPQDVGPFRVHFAFGSEPRTIEYRLRYQVFVDECHFESADALPDGLERDQFDTASCSLLLVDRETGDAAGCQRLVLPDHLPPGVPTNIERQYAAATATVPFTRLPRHTWAEASRTTVVRRFRWGSGTAAMPAMIAIHYASIALAMAFGRDTLYSLSERRTQRLIRRLGFPMVQVAAPIEFHGIRAAFEMRVDHMLAAVPSRDRDFVDALLCDALQVSSRAQRTSCGRTPVLPGMSAATRRASWA